jgi:hypothetical protein
LIGATAEGGVFHVADEVGGGFELETVKHFQSPFFLFENAGLFENGEVAGDGGPGEAEG